MPRSKVVTAESGIIHPLLSELKTLHTVVAQMSELQPVLMALVKLLGPGQEGAAQPVKKWPVYLREWRVSRGKSLDDLGKVVGLTKGQLSRVETGHQPYNQRILEGYAEVLGCRPGDLLTHAPFPLERALELLLLEPRAVRSRQDRVVS